MLNKLTEFIRRYGLLQPGERVVCAVSGGADSMALLWAMYLLRQRLDIRLAAAHFNHGLRGEESDRDAAFVRDFCRDYGIEFYEKTGSVTAGKKGLEAAARDARYAFLQSLPGKIATAHTANDNAETVLLHLVRGTGLKGLGGITPIRGNLIRPMLTVTREEVLSFLEEYSIDYVTDSSNETDGFLRNRLRHHVWPLLQKENPRLAENLSEMALGLRLDEQALAVMTEQLPDVPALRAMLPALRSRALAEFLRRSGVKEPEREHIMLAESLVFSPKPSASAVLPGGITICREYDRLTVRQALQTWEPLTLPCPGTVEAGGYRIRCREATESCFQTDRFTVRCSGALLVRPRQAGDAITLSGGTKSLKKLFIDRKLPAALRDWIPVIADEEGLLGVCGIGVDLRRYAKEMPAVEIKIEKL